MNWITILLELRILSTLWLARSGTWCIILICKKMVILLRCNPDLNPTIWFLWTFKPVNFGFELVDQKWETVLLWKLPLTFVFSIWNLYYNQLFIPALYSLGRIQCCLCPLCLSPGGLWWGRWNYICYLFIYNLFIHLFIYLCIYLLDN